MKKLNLYNLIIKNGLLLLNALIYSTDASLFLLLLKTYIISLTG